MGDLNERTRDMAPRLQQWTPWQHWFTRHPRAPRNRAAVPRRCRLHPEVLEDRTAPAVLTVNTLADDNPTLTLSLRQAIGAVNAQSADGLTPQQRLQVTGALGDNDRIQFSVTGTVALQQGELDITRPVVLAGPGAGSLTIDARSASRVFGVLAAEMDVTLSGLMITGGAAASGGGVYTAGGALTVRDSVLTGSAATGLPGSGGGIYSLGTLTVVNSTISDNRGNRGEGGGIYSAGLLVVRHSTITDNVGGRASSGGGIFLQGRGEVSNSRVAHNTAESGGGGIDSDADLTLRGDEIADNVAFHGGGVRNGRTLEVDGGTFTENYAIDGGALDNLLGATARVAGALLTGNSQTNYGAAVENAGTMTINGSIIRDNTSAYVGAIYNLGTLSIVGSAITGNRAYDPATGVDGSGGGIYNSGELMVAFSAIVGNVASGTSGGDGGGIYNSGAGYLTIIASLIGVNSARRDGGGVYNAGTATIDRSAVVFNSAGEAGGGLYATASSQATIIDTLFLGNDPDDFGGPGQILRKKKCV
jgi:hypothetical protein